MGFLEGAEAALDFACWERELEQDPVLNAHIALSMDEFEHRELELWAEETDRRTWGEYDDGPRG